MQFRYEAYTRDGQKLFGSIDAESREEASAELYKKDLLVSQIGTFQQKNKSGISEGDLILFTRLLANAMDAHLPLARSLELTLGEMNSKSALAPIAASLLSEIKAGKTVTQAFQLFPMVFSRFYIGMIRAGEKSGKLAYSFNQILLYLTKRFEMKRKITSALAYPLFVIFFAAAVLFFFITYLIPRFQDSYASFGSQIPAFTRFLVGGANWFKGNIVWIILLIVAAAVFLYWYSRQESGRLTLEKLLFRTPVAGQIYQKNILSRIARTVSVLQTNGITLLDSIELSQGIVNNRIFEGILRNSARWITEGRSMAASLKENRFIPSIVIQMITMGEESGRMAELMGYLADFYEKDVDSAVEKITSLITPVLIGIIGVIIGVIVIGLFLPIFDISQMLK